MAHYYFSIIFYLFLLTGSIISEDVSSSKSENLDDFACPVQAVYSDYSFKWIIENYNFLSLTAEVLKSPAFPPEGPDSRDWHIEFVPKQITEDSTEILNLIFKRERNAKLIHSFPSLTISTNSGKSREFTRYDNDLERPLSVSFLHNVLDWNWNRNQSLIISTTIRVLSSTINSCGKPTETNNWLEDISQFLSKDITLQDFTIIVQGEGFYAHKDILAARSSVFSRMFSEDREQGIIKDSMEINDLSSETVGNMITYIYTDDVEELSQGKLSSELLVELLAAARTYDLKELEAMCMTAMYKNPSSLNVDNVLEVLEAADKYSILNLKKSALKFILAHRQLLKDTDKFKSLTAKRPDLMVELSKLHDGVRADPEDLENLDVIRTVVELQ